MGSSPSPKELARLLEGLVEEIDDVVARIHSKLRQAPFPPMVEGLCSLFPSSPTPVGGWLIISLDPEVGVRMYRTSDGTCFTTDSDDVAALLVAGGVPAVAQLTRALKRLLQELKEAAEKFEELVASAKLPGSWDEDLKYLQAEVTMLELEDDEEDF